MVVSCAGSRYDSQRFKGKSRKVGEAKVILQIMNCYDDKVNVNVGKLADISCISVMVLSGDEILRVVKKNGKILEKDSDIHGRTINFYDGQYTIYDSHIGLNKIRAWRKRKDSNDWIMGFRADK